MPRILAYRRDVCYLIIGEGPQRELIETRIASLHLNDHVVLLGRVDDDTLRAAYHVSDLFVMPNIPVQNDIEGFGLVALEAASAGRYVVASRLDGIPEAIVPGQNGVLLDPLDSEAFASTIIELLDDDARREELGLKAQDFVRDHYSWDIVAKRYWQIFRRVMNSTVEARKRAGGPPTEVESQPTGSQVSGETSEVASREAK